MKMLEDIYMSEEDLYNFFNKYSLDELQLFKIRFEFVENIPEQKEIFEQVYLEKINSDTKEDERDLTERIMEKNKDLTREELAYLYNLVSAIPYYFIEGLEELNKGIYIEMNNRLIKDIPFMTDEELEIFFNKYNLYELELFEIIIPAIKNIGLSEALSIAREVYEKKYNELDPEEQYYYNSTNMHIVHNTNDIVAENDKLTAKELEYLNSLIINSKENDISKQKIKK